MKPSLPDFSKARILVLGDVMLDQYTWGTVNRISPEAPIPVVRIKDRTNRLGGAGNVAANLAGLGCSVSLVGLLGKDAAGESFGQLLSERGIANASLYSQNLPTVTKTRIMAGNQQIVRLDDEQPEKVQPELRRAAYQKICGELKRHDVLIISDYGKGLLNDSLLRDCMNVCSKENFPVFIDPKRDDWSIYAGATCITPNLKEFEGACQRMGSDSSDMEKSALHFLQRYGLHALLVTQGAKGMTLFNSQSRPFFVPSKARDVYDVSGAGDTVISVLAAAAAVGCSMATAVELANLAAAEVVSRLGTYAITLLDLKSAVLENNGSQCAVYSAFQIRELVEHWRMSGQRVVFTNGCFDILHPGHVSLLRRAKELGDRLVVGLNTDASIRRIKGPSRPIIEQNDRAAILSALGPVDAVVLFEEDTPKNLLKFLQPDVLVKGGDYAMSEVVGAELMKKWGGRVEILDLLGKKSTSAVLKKILSTASIEIETA